MTRLPDPAMVQTDVRSDSPMTLSTALTISWNDDMLTIHDERIPGGKVEVWYIEAYCRSNSHGADCTWRCGM